MKEDNWFEQYADLIAKEEKLKKQQAKSPGKSSKSK